MQQPQYPINGDSMNYTQQHPSPQRQQPSLPHQTMMHMPVQQQPQQTSGSGFAIGPHSNNTLSSSSSTSTTTTPQQYSNQHQYLQQQQQQQQQPQQQQQQQPPPHYGAGMALCSGGVVGGGAPIPAFPVDYKPTDILAALSKTNQQNEQTYEINYPAVERYAKDTQLLADYQEACSMTLTDDEEYLHMLYARLPTDLSRDDRKYRAIVLVYSTYLNKYSQLVERRPCLIEYLFMLCCLLVRVTRNENVLLTLKNGNVTANPNFNKFLFRKTGTFKLPRMVKRAVERKDQRKHTLKFHTDDQPVATTMVAAGASSHGTGAGVNDSKRLKRHPIYELTYINDQVLSLGKFLHDCIPLDFVPLHCTVRPTSVTHYAAGDKPTVDGSSGGTSGLSGSGGNQSNKHGTEPGVAIDSQLRIFAVLSTCRIQNYTYQNVDQRFCKTFVNFVHDILPGRHLDRFRVNTLKAQNCTNLVTMETAQVGLSMLPMVLCERMSLFATRTDNMSPSSSAALSTQSFPAHTFVINTNEYDKIKNAPTDYTVRHCERLQREYGIPYEDDEESEQQQPRNIVATPTDTSNPLSSSGNEPAASNDNDDDLDGVDKDDEEEEEEETVAE